MKAKIIWFPKFLISVTKDNINFCMNKKHLKKIEEDIKKFGLYFPGVIMKNEIHSGHHRMYVAKKLGYDGIEMYEVNNYSDVNFLSRFNELSYKFLKSARKLEKKFKPNKNLSI